ncbi:MAG: glutathione peroxidase [Bacilli bacterium]
MNLYELTVKNMYLKDVPLSQYQGKVLLIVNTAIKCGYTPQYEGLEKLFQMYKDRGFEILDFPCNQFLHQAPGSNEELANFCQLKYHTTFETFGKIDVNGKNEESLYRFLKDTAPEKNGKNIKWNFTKFLVSRDGQSIHRFESAVTPEALSSKIEALL